MATEIETSTTYVEVVLKIEHAAVIGDDELFTVVDQAFGTVVALVANEHGAGLSQSEDYVSGYAATNPIAVLRTALHTVWVRGSTP